jgi:hypothetical protein
MPQPSPSQLEAARKASDRKARTKKMADTMRETAIADGACQSNHLRAAGFTDAEIWAYADDARAILSGRKPARSAVTSARKQAKALVEAARVIRARIHGAREAARG